MIIIIIYIPYNLWSNAMFIPAGLTRESEALVRLEFPMKVLVRLLAHGHLHAAEFRCLDLQSQHKVRRALLQSCLESLKGDWS
ncbi:MAG: hypothetical protein ACK4JF_08505 [Methylohalobius sp.]